MRKIWLLLGITAFLFAATLPAAQKKSDGGPRLSIDETSHDFGVVQPGTPLRYSFTFQNEGTEDLKILSVTPG